MISLIRGSDEVDAFEETTIEELSNLLSSPNTKENIFRFIGIFETRKIILEHPVVTVEQAVKDFKRERVILNGVAFIPDANDVFRL